MSELHQIQHVLSEAGIESEEIFDGQGSGCPVCVCMHLLAA